MQFDCFTRAADDYAAYNLTVTNTATADAFTTCCFTFSREMSPSKRRQQLIQSVTSTASPVGSEVIASRKYSPSSTQQWTLTQNHKQLVTSVQPCGNLYTSLS